jgi:hypothetical protein
MFHKSPRTRVLLGHCRKQVGLLVFGVISILAAVPLLIAHPVEAATNNALNFQARLHSASGAIVADGYYNVEFKLYSASSGGTSLWTETWYDTNGATSGQDYRLKVKNGYLTANLGTLTAFPTTINWDQDLWMTMNIGGTSQTSPSYDGEMDPRLKLTGIPYAFKAGQLAQYNASTGFTSSLQLQNPTGGNQIFILPDQGAAGTYTLLTEDSAAANSIQNASSPQQDANFNISGIGKAGALQADSFDTTDASTLSLGSDNASAINIGSVGTTTTVYGDLVVTGSTTGQAGATLSGAAISLNNSSNFTTSINTGSSTGQVSIGGGSGTFALNTTNIDISNSGAISGATGLTLSSGNIDQSASSGTFKTGTGAVSLNGDTVIASGKNLTANGTALFQSSSNSTTAFRVQNAAGVDVIAVDTTSNSANLITNPSFETNTTGWAARASTTNFQRTTAQHYTGNAALSFATAGAGQGVNYPVQLSPNTNYTMTVFIKATGVSASTVRIGYAADGSTESTYQSTAMGYGPSGWRQLNYSFTTPGTVAGNAYLYVLNTDATSRTIYIDTTSVWQSTADHPIFGEATLRLDGTVTSQLHLRNSEDSTQAFNVQASNGSQLLAVDTLDGSVNVGDVNSTSARFAVRTSTKVAVNVIQNGNFDILTLTDTSGTSKDVFRVQDEGAVLLQNSTDSAAALQVRNLAGSNIFTVDTTSAQVVLGKASTTAGKLVFANSSNANTAAIQSGATSSSYTLTLPTALNGANACLVDTTGTGTLGFVACPTGSGTSVQFASGTVQADSSSNSSIFINKTGSGNLLQLQRSGADVLTVGSEGAMLVQPSTDSATAVQFKNSIGVSIFSIDTLNRQIGTNATTAADTSSQRLAIKTGDATGTGASSTGDITLRSGSSTNANSGNVSIEVGTAGATYGNINIGTLYRSNSINIGIIGAINTASTVNIANTTSTSATQTVAIGSNTRAANSTTIQGGSTGGINLQGVTNVNVSLNNNTNINTGTSTGLVSVGGGSGTFALDTTNIDISSTGAITGATGLALASGNFVQTGVGTFDTGTGAVSLNGDTTIATGKTLTVRGVTSINASLNNNTSINTGTSSGVVAIGGGSGTLTLDTTNIDISSTGAITGATGLALASGNFAQTGSGTFSTGTGNVSLNGNVSVATGKTLTVVGAATSLTGVSTGSAVATQINTGAASNIGLVVKAATSQSASLLALQDSGGIALFTVASAGQVTATNGVALSGGNFAQSGSGTFDTGTGNVGLNGKTSIINSVSGDYGLHLDNTNTNGKGVLIDVNGSDSVNNTALAINNSSQQIFKISGSGDMTLDGTASIFGGLDVQYGGAAIRDNNNVQQLLVDSSGSRVIIGQTGGDTTGTILTLGNKTNTGDPTGAAGAMYYNAAIGAFRCYTDHWQSCLQNSRTSYNYTNDMFGLADRTICSATTCGLTASTDMAGYYGNSGDYSLNDFAGTASHPGIGAFWTNGNATAYAGITTPKGTNTILLGSGDYWKYETDIQLKQALSVTSNQYNFISGFTNSQTSTDGTNGCFIKYTNTTALNTPTFVGKCVSNGTASTCTSTLPTVAVDTWYRTSVEVNSAGTLATFKVNGASCTVSSNIPVVSGREVSPQTMMYKMSGTTAVFFTMDYVTIEGQFGTAR